MYDTTFEKAYTDLYVNVLRFIQFLLSWCTTIAHLCVWQSDPLVVTDYPEMVSPHLLI